MQRRGAPAARGASSRRPWTGGRRARARPRGSSRRRRRGRGGSPPSRRRAPRRGRRGRAGRASRARGAPRVPPGGGGRRRRRGDRRRGLARAAPGAGRRRRSGRGRGFPGGRETRREAPSPIRTGRPGRRGSVASASMPAASTKAPSRARAWLSAALAPGGRPARFRRPFPLSRPLPAPDGHGRRPYRGGRRRARPARGAGASLRAREATRDALHRASAGDLTLSRAALARSGEAALAEALHGLMVAMERILASFARLSEAVSGVARDLTTRGRDLSLAAAVQNARAEETAAAMRGTDAAIGSLRESMETLAGAAENAGASLHEMTASVTQVSRSTSALRSFVDETAASLAGVVSALQEVASAVENLSGLAGETARATSAIRASTAETDRQAQTAARLSERVSAAVVSGKAAVSGTLAGMHEIRGAVSGRGRRGHGPRRALRADRRDPPRHRGDRRRDEPPRAERLHHRGAGGRERQDVLRPRRRHPRPLRPDRRSRPRRCAASSRRSEAASRTSGASSPTRGGGRRRGSTSRRRPTPRSTRSRRSPSTRGTPRRGSRAWPSTQSAGGGARLGSDGARLVRDHPHLGGDARPARDGEGRQRPRADRVRELTEQLARAMEEQAAGGPGAPRLDGEGHVDRRRHRRGDRHPGGRLVRGRPVDGRDPEGGRAERLRRDIDEPGGAGARAGVPPAQVPLLALPTPRAGPGRPREGRPPLPQRGATSTRPSARPSRRRSS